MSAISGNRNYTMGHVSSHRDDAHSSVSRNSPRRDHLTPTYSLDTSVVHSATRQKQSKRDEAIRKRLESDLSKKKYNPTRAHQNRKSAPGTVLSFKLSAALHVKPNTTVGDAAQMMAAKREDCVLVTDGDDRLSGIFTAKDLAFRVVGAGKRARDTTIADIMTRNPLCARTDTNATEALDLMVRMGFRHLPVMDENQDIFGVLDITKCFYETMEKLERIYNSSSKLYMALEGVNSELGSNHPHAIVEYVDALRQKLSSPTLESVLDGSVPTAVSVRTTVKEAATLMKENHTTALLVQDQGSIAGIFTSKDVVLRVIAPGLDPGTCSVVRVMTPHPDFAPSSMTIQAALRKMHDGHYLNLPVIGDENGEIVGMVDVLRLTYATLEQVNTMQTAEAEGPAWNKFWLSADQDTESVYSDNAGSATGLSASHGGLGSRSQASLDVSKNADGESSHAAESASGVDDDNLSNERHSLQQETDVPFPFKFRAPNGRIHRIQLRPSSGIPDLVHLVASRLASSEIEALGGEAEIREGVLVNGFALSYVDAEGDFVSLTADHDINEAIRLARQGGMEKVDLYVHDPEHPPSSAGQDLGIQHHHQQHQQQQQHLVSDSNVSEEASHPVEDEDDGNKPAAAEVIQTSDRSIPEEQPDLTVRLRNFQEQLYPGIPNEMILSGGAILLTAMMVGVYMLGRSTSR